MKAVGIFGGTFDPVHNGHLITAQAVCEMRQLEKVIFIPAFIAPHKQDVLSSSPAHRLEMLKAAVDGIPFFEVSDYELAAGGISYTVDTLREFKKKYDKIELIIGYDNFLQFNSWKEPLEILKLVQVIVLRRKTEETAEASPEGFTMLDTPVIEISATDIRKRVQKGLPVNFLVPDKVMEYIYTFNLYRTNR